MRLFRICAILVVGSWASAGFAKEKPDPLVPTADAQQLIDKVRAAYAALTSLDLAGKLQADLDIAGQKQNRSIDFVAQYQAPGKFRHQVKDEVLAGSTGEKVYILEEARNVYASSDAPAQRGSYKQFSPVIVQLMEMQDPGLILAVSANSIGDVVDGAKLVRLEDPKAEGAQPLPTLAYTANDGRDVKLSFDPKTNLLVQASYDLSNMMRDRGAEQVKKALVTIQYSKHDAGAKFADTIFAWAPPANARELSMGSEGDTVSLENTAAPDFTLTGLDGKKVTLSQQKGSVVLLDFWATWCPPCVKGLPEINELQRANKSIKVFAINVAEDKPTIESFMKEKGLDLPVLLDTDDTLSDPYKIRGIPTTIVIKPDGVIQKVFVGLPAGGKEEIQREIDAAGGKK